MNPLEQEYDITGYLTEDFRHIELDSPAMVRMVCRKLAGVQLDIRVKPLRENRSNSQNRYFHGVVLPHIQAWLHITKGEKHTPDEVYAWVKISLLGLEPKVVNILGEDVIMMKEKSFSKMSTKEFAETVDLIRDKMYQLGCNIPEPTKNNHLAEHYNRDLYKNINYD